MLYVQCRGTDDGISWMTNRMGMLGVSVRKMKALTEDGQSDTDW